MKQYFFWIAPFIFFLAGYYATSRFVRMGVIETPAVVGLSLPDALKVISARQLCGQIVAEKEDDTVPEDTIVDQSPGAGRAIKVHRSVYLVVTKKAPSQRAPALVNMTQPAIESIIQPLVRVAFHQLESQYPRGTCFGQYPLPDQELPDRTVHAYISRGFTPLRLLPQCIGRPVYEVTEFFKSHGIPVQFFHMTGVDLGHTCDTCMVCEQKPFAGTIIDMRKPITIQLGVAQ